MPYTPNNPLVPGDPYSYDLKWIVEKLKEAISLYQPLSTEFQELHDYVMNYFAQLDISAEVSAKIDQMAADGSLDALIRPYFDAYKAEIDDQITGLESNMNAVLADMDVLESRMDGFTNLPVGSTAGDAELMDIRSGANGKTYANAGDAVRGQIDDMARNIDGNAASNNQLIHYQGYYEQAASANWPAFTFAGRISKWNGTFGTSNNYYIDLCNPTYTTTSLSNIRSNAVPLSGLTNGHIYKITAKVIEGSLTLNTGQYFNACVYNPDQGTVETPINTSKTFLYSQNTAIFFLKISKNVVTANAVVSVSIEDITDSVKPTDVEQIQLRALSWSNGRHITRGNSIAAPTSSANTICLLTPISYDYDMYFELAADWTAAFVSVDNGIVSGIANSFMPSGKITMLDVYNNLEYPTASYFGDKLAINLRKADSSNVDFYNINIDDIIKAFKVVRKKNPAKTPTKWVAIGDSITDGRYSQSDGTVRTKTNHFCQYGYIASKILGVDEYVEEGYGGMGYVSPANDGITYLDDILAIDFGSPDIITVNLGVNDRSQPLGDENSLPHDGTISGSVRNCCEVLGSTYGDSHIIFMTPLNATRTGSLDTGWCKRSGPTHLEDIANIIKYWANRFGFPVIDMLSDSPVNDFNIQGIMLDQEHPTMEAHCMIGKYLAAKLPINF